MKDSLCDEFCNKNKTKKRGIESPLLCLSQTIVFETIDSIIIEFFYSLNLIKPVSPVFAPNVISIHRYADIQMGGKLPRGRPIVRLFDPKDPLFCQIDEIRSNDFWFS